MTVLLTTPEPNKSHRELASERLWRMSGLCGDTAVTDDETETVSFSVVSVERVLGRGDLVALAILSSLNW